MSQLKPRRQRGLRPQPEDSAPVWGGGDRPTWLALEQDQPKKREWSPARDRMEAEMELRARLEEQRRLRRRSSLKRVLLPVMWLTSLAMAVVDVGRREGGADIAGGLRPVGGPTPLDTLPPGLTRVPGARPLPAGWPPPPPPPAPPAPPAEPASPAERPASEIGTAPLEKPAVEWPEHVEPPPSSSSAPAPPALGGESSGTGAIPARPTVPNWDWRPVAVPRPQPEGGEEPPAAPPAPEADWGAPEAEPAPPAPTADLPPAAPVESTLAPPVPESTAPEAGAAPAEAAETAAAESAAAEREAAEREAAEREALRAAGELAAAEAAIAERDAAERTAAAEKAAEEREAAERAAAERAAAERAAAERAAAEIAAAEIAAAERAAAEREAAAERDAPVDPRDVVGSILATCVRASGAQVGVLILLQDDNLVVRACSGVSNEMGAKLALDVVSDICLEVIASGQPFMASSPSETPSRDPYVPLTLLCVPVPLGIAQAGVVLLTGYLPNRPFTEEHQRLVTSLASRAAPALVDAGAFALEVTPGGDAWRRLAEVAAQPQSATQILGSPWRRMDGPPPPADTATAGETQILKPEDIESMVAGDPDPARAGEGDPEYQPTSTMNLDPDRVSKIIADAKTARADHEQAQPQPQDLAPAPPPVVAPMPPPVAPMPPPEASMSPPVAPPPPAPAPPPVEAAPAAVAPPAPPDLAPDEPVELTPATKRKKDHSGGWARQVGRRMGQIQEQREADQQRERSETLAAVRNLSWDGYQALIADIFRRKAFEVFPPPSSGSDLDVIDMVVDRDEQRMLVNCQLRNIDQVPLAAVTEMATVVYNYSVSGAYIITDGKFDVDAVEYASTAAIVLIDANSLIDLVVETTITDERKPTVGRRLAGAFGRRR